MSADHSRLAADRAVVPYGDQMPATDETVSAIALAILALVGAIDRQTEVIDQLRKDIRK